MTARARPEWIADHPDQAIPKVVKLTEADILARSQTEANTGCWLWERGAEASGYGSWTLPGRRKERAHRMAYIIARGPIPRGLHVCHRCDTPACCNPAHLFLGTPAENLQDMGRKGRGKLPPPRLGVDHHAARLTEADVRAIRSDPRGGPAVARDYGITRTMVSFIRRRLSWGHVQ